MLWKTLAGVSVGVPVAAGLQYAVSTPRERRKMRIVVEGFGRLCRFVLHADSDAKAASSIYST